ncbi:MAG: AAA family ATPase [Firmicutes bacterium]|nr:AAA family ATPase [Bacillota bacterium]
MINKIHIKALKSIKDLTIHTTKLNLFVGTNSSGKSTLLQAILLAVQNAEDDIGLNGKWVSIGDFREVRNYYMPGEAIRIEFELEGQSNPQWVEFSEDRERETCVIRRSESNNLHELLVHYLSCHRIGANDIYAKNMMGQRDFGIDGEYALAYLLKNEEEPVADELLIADSGITSSLLEQVNYWLNYIVGTTLSVNDIKKTNYLQVKYNNNPANVSSEALYCRPVNVGSGISYLISVIIVCLGAEKDAAILIENPEIHLHPKAQSRLCDFLHFVSSAGRQLFVETHSDHIFNGLRVGVASGTIKQENISVNFFAVNDQYETQCNPIAFGEFGKIIGTNKDMDINDLFDQFELDLDRMLGL